MAEVPGRTLTSRRGRTVSGKTQALRWALLDKWLPPTTPRTTSEWETVQLEDVLSPLTPRPMVPDTGNVRFAGVKWYGEGLFIREERAAGTLTAKCYPLMPGALVYNRLFAWKQAFALVGDEFDGVVVSNEFPQFTIDSQANPQYIRLVCASRSFADTVLARSSGSTAVSRNRLAVADFLTLDIPLPPTPVQDDLVASFTRVMNDADHLQARAAELINDARGEFEAALVGSIAKTEQSGMCRIAYFRDLLRWDGPAVAIQRGWLWPEAALADVADIRLGVQIPRKGTGTGEPYPYLRAASVQRGWLDLDDVKTMRVSSAQAEALRLQAGDVVFVEGNGSSAEVGRCAVWQNKIAFCIHQNSVVRARPNTDVADPMFLACWFNSTPGSAYVREHATTTSGLFHIGAGKLGAAPVPLPPLEVQQRLAANLMVAQQEADTMAAKVEALRLQAKTDFESAVFGASATQVYEHPTAPWA